MLLTRTLRTGETTRTYGGAPRSPPAEMPTTSDLGTGASMSTGAGRVISVTCQRLRWSALDGFVHPDFVGVAQMFRRQVSRRARSGASLAVYHRGEPVLDIWGGTRGDGHPWREDTMAMAFSTTKGIAATSLHILADRGLIGYDDLVSTHWPEFASHGKDGLTVRHLLSHDAGLHALRPELEHAAEMLDWDHMVEVMEGMTPRWAPRHATGYHGITFGWLIGELVRRVSGMPLKHFVDKEIAAPLKLDGLFIGAPASEMDRVARLKMGALKLGDVDSTASRIKALSRSLRLKLDLTQTIDTFLIRGFDELLASEDVYQAEIPAMTGIFTARSVARLYATLAGGGQLGGVRLLSAETVRAASVQQNNRIDRVVGYPMRFRLGYHGAFTTSGIPSRGIAHYGYGGSGGFADPHTDLAVGYVVNSAGGTPTADARLPFLAGAALRAARKR